MFLSGSRIMTMMMPLLAEASGVGPAGSTGRVGTKQATWNAPREYRDMTFAFTLTNRSRRRGSKLPAQNYTELESRAVVRLVRLSFKEVCTSYESKSGSVMYILLSG